jgi:hypothetical protein
LLQVPQDFGLIATLAIILVLVVRHRRRLPHSRQEKQQ